MRWERAFPRSIKAASKSIRALYNEGERSRTGAMIYPVDPNDPKQVGEQVLRAVGFQPTGLTRKWGLIQAQNSHILNLRTQRQQLLNALNHAIVNEDREYQADVIRQISDFNAKLGKQRAGTFAIKASTIRKSLKEKARRRARQELGLPPSRQGTDRSLAIEETFPVIDERKVR